MLSKTAKQLTHLRDGRKPSSTDGNLYDFSKGRSMKNSLQYSTCLYNEEEPIGTLGRGSHYSVFRVAEWKNVVLEPLNVAETHDFAVIWDEDHDERIFPIIERLYMSGLLSPVQFIGERKGTLTIIAAARLWGNNLKKWDEWRREVSAVGVDVDGDYWNVEIGMFDRATVNGMTVQTDIRNIINDSDEKVITYLRNIDNLWKLGTKLYQVQPQTRPELLPPTQPLISGEQKK